jgi:hypothetical protein
MSTPDSLPSKEKVLTQLRKVDWNGGLSEEAQAAITAAIEFLDSSAPEPSADASAETRARTVEQAYELGWRAASDWTKRGDLISDIDSPAYLEDRKCALGEPRSVPPPEADACKNCGKVATRTCLGTNHWICDACGMDPDGYEETLTSLQKISNARLDWSLGCTCSCEACCNFDTLLVAECSGSTKGDSQ